ncbi:MAG TPA: ABC transporter permease [Thermoanaerobaculia bacterium]|nr:ABC transporter permease [Thermoanaerobaculia bacterium]
MIGRRSANGRRLPLLVRAALRDLARRPAQLALAVVGVALGVAVVVAVDVANASVFRAFTLSTEAVTGRATHQVAGGPTGLDERLFARLALATGVAAAPIVEDYVRVAPAAPGGVPSEHRRSETRVLHLLGVDPFSERPFRPDLADIRPAGGAATGAGRDRPADQPAATGSLAALLLRPGACLLAADMAAELGLAPGSRFQVLAGGVPREAELVGLLARPRSESASQAIADLMVMDVAAAQELLGRNGTLDRIDLRLEQPGRTATTTANIGGAAPFQDLEARVAALLPPGAQLLPAGGQTSAALALTRAFRVNLSALSLLALLCGAFLVYNTMTFSVVRRRTLLGTLRALGVTRQQVLALVLGEAAALALAGTGLGIAAGVALGRILVRLVTQTVNDLYFVVSVRALTLSPATLAKAAAIGIGATLLAALAPALEATLTPPRAVLNRSSLEARLRRTLPRATLLGAVVAGAGGVLLALPGGGLVVSFAALAAIVVGSALLAPAATVLLMRLLRAPAGRLFGILGRLAAGGVEASLSRTAVAIAALMVAVAVTVGIGVMIDSFRQTVVRWLEGTLRADIYVTAASRAGLHGAALDPALARQAAALPGVLRVNDIRRAEIAAPDGAVSLLAVGTDRRGFGSFELLAGDRERAWLAFAKGDGVLVSEPYFRRTGTGVGRTVRLRTAAGDHDFTVAGVFYDYTSDRGIVMISRRSYVRFWRDPALSGFSLYLAPGADAGLAIGRLRRLLASPGANTAGGAGAAGGAAARPALSIRPNRALKKASLEIFDRTFLITGVLRLLAGLVAAIGILSALSALQLERARELGVLRANGLTPGQVWQLVTAQTGLMGLAAGLLAWPLGLALSAILVYVINRRSFGWSMRLAVSPGILLEALLLALAAALAAGLYPAYRMARTRPALALREE